MPYWNVKLSMNITSIFIEVICRIAKVIMASTFTFKSSWIMDGRCGEPFRQLSN